MRLKKSRITADEQLLRLVNDGYALLHAAEGDFESRLREPNLDEHVEVAHFDQRFRAWSAAVVCALGEIFPTERESYLFVRADSQPVPQHDGVHVHFWNATRRVERFVQRLDAIRLSTLGTYTNLPIGMRLHVEDVDSFAKVRDVNPHMVSALLKDGRIELLEDEVQVALERILNVEVHRRDHGGETNDLYTSNLVVNGARTATAFVLKGRGCKSRELTNADCGKNGDQLVKLMESPADLFILQYVGAISDNVIKDLHGKIEARRARGLPGWYCIIDGQDTARLLRAYDHPLGVAR